MTCEAKMFTCTQCGDCCKGFGGTYIEVKDISAIAAHLNISQEELLNKYCVMSGNRPVLGQRADGFCVFFRGNCSIHEVKPQMCRKWPFIDSILVDPNNWKIMAEQCPGMNRDVDQSRLLCCVRSQLKKSSKTP